MRFSVSFRTLLVLAFLLVALLPSMALVRMWWRLDQLSLIAETRLADVDRRQHALHALSERDEHLERSARQWLALQDPAFRQLAQGFAGDMKVQSAQLALLTDTSLSLSLAEENRLLGHITYWLATGGTLAPDTVVAWFDGLSANHAHMELRLRELAQQQQIQWADSLRQQRVEAGRLALLSVLLALVLAMVLGYILFAPLGRLRVQIGKLAQGVRGQSWRVAGPSDVRVLALALARLDARLEQLEAEKASFFRQVSHELKTPLAAINEAAALLADEVAGTLCAAQHEIVAIQLSNVATLRSRVDTLLQHDVARWLSQQVIFSPFSLLALQQKRMHEWQALTSRREVSVVARLLVDQVWGDEQKVQTILDNLLINAIRFSPAGGMVSLSSRREEGVIYVCVADQGQGVAPDDAKRIFDPFFCGAPPAGENPGSGIGLTMARTFAQLMGGDVRLLPTDKNGACFELWWPESENCGAVHQK